ncbi:MAG: disulfide oxidoreductase [Planctomycetes bacterium]|nr:disulfide oxidoreductase [Planctomycetota bacterium]
MSLVAQESNLAALAKTREAAVKEVLASFGVIHCTGCAVPQQTVAQAAAAHQLPVELLVNALRGALGEGK